MNIDNMGFNSKDIKFPVDWHYKVICYKNDDNACDEITKMLRTHGFDQIPEKGLESKNGKYQTYKVSVTFSDLESMRNLSNALSALPCVKFLI